MQIKKTSKIYQIVNRIYRIAKLPSLFYHEAWHFIFIFILKVKVIKISYKCDLLTGEFLCQFWLKDSFGIKTAIIMVGPIIGMITLLLISWKFLFIILIFWKGFFLSKIDRQTLFRSIKKIFVVQFKF